jgi:hypothetical protein
MKEKGNRIMDCLTQGKKGVNILGKFFQISLHWAINRIKIVEMIGLGTLSKHI